MLSGYSFINFFFYKNIDVLLLQNVSHPTISRWIFPLSLYTIDDCRTHAHCSNLEFYCDVKFKTENITRFYIYFISHTSYSLVSTFLVAFSAWNILICPTTRISGSVSSVRNLADSFEVLLYISNTCVIKTNCLFTRYDLDTKRSFH